MEAWQKRDDPNILVEAVRLTEENVEAVAVWCHAEKIEEHDLESPGEMRIGLNVDTPNGVERASYNMYVARYGGKFFVMHNRPFELKYRPRDRPAPPPESAGDSRRQRGFADPFDSGRFHF